MTSQIVSDTQTHEIGGSRIGKNIRKRIGTMEALGGREKHQQRGASSDVAVVERRGEDET